ncbi:YARHG domain-containing protein [Clostridiaceae bacterium UIB06]|uniref:YARHG domain-containing protein n=1 Tax=Clostridium thailandense TaxID=2794346 RepID=A0A949TYC1_9CLOT|nr:YARHG domain-containing protein [Clostridium thailandense]MBV7273133.1 YARHG domain-containing protein [Clostridium thailandense]MCH5137541.1 YARHG domain-containing protein [Clostridiaceae bacterium UIB06]
MDKCKKCGTPFDENDKFCSTCGTRRESENIVVEEKTTKNLETATNKTNSDMNSIKECKWNTDRISIPEDKKEKDHFTRNENLQDDSQYYRSEEEERYTEGLRIGKSFYIILGVLFLFSFIGGYIFYVSNNTKSNQNTEIGNNQTVEYNNSNSNKNSNSGNSKAGEYIFPYSNKKPLTAKDVKNMSKEKLALARNEIFARHGYVFEGEPYESYFKGKSWYKPDTKFTGEGKQLSAVERHNIRIIMRAEGLEKNLAPNYDADYKAEDYK